MYSKLKLLYYKLFNSKMMKTAYHEAGHCLVASLFAEKITLKYLTLDKVYLKKINPKWNGGLLLEWGKEPEQTDYESGDHMILIALAGICSQTIFVKGKEYVQMNINNPKLFDYEGSEKDIEIAQSFSYPIAENIGIDKNILEVSAYKWIIEFLIDENIWEGVSKVALELFEKNNKSLIGDEIKEYLSKIGISEYISNNKEIFLNKRYPLI